MATTSTNLLPMPVATRSTEHSPNSSTDSLVLDENGRRQQEQAQISLPALLDHTLLATAHLPPVTNILLMDEPISTSHSSSSLMESVQEQVIKPLYRAWSATLDYLTPVYEQLGLDANTQSLLPNMLRPSRKERRRRADQAAMEQLV